MDRRTLPASVLFPESPFGVDMENKRRALMDLCEGGLKISITNAFARCYRKGITKEELLESVIRKQFHFLNNYPNEQSYNKAIYKVITDNRDISLGYAEFMIWYSSLPRGCQNEIKARRHAQFQEPTASQFKELKRLGYEGELRKIQSRAEANALIIEMLLK